MRSEPLAWCCADGPVRFDRHGQNVGRAPTSFQVDNNGAKTCRRSGSGNIGTRSISGGSSANVMCAGKMTLWPDIHTKKSGVLKTGGVCKKAGGICDQPADCSSIGDCTVLVDEFQRYGSCNGYCSSMGRTCVAAWDEVKDQCVQEFSKINGPGACSSPYDGTSDAICQCSDLPQGTAKAKVVIPGSPLSFDLVERTLEYPAPGALCPPTAHATAFDDCECALCAATVCMLDPPSPMPAIIGGAIAGLILVFLLSFAESKRRERIKLQRVKAELRKFQNNIIGVRAVTGDYDPRSTEAVGGTEAWGESPASSALKPTEVAPVKALWYWQEDSDKISKHAASSVKQPGNYVAYGFSVCRELNEAYAKYRQELQAPTHGAAQHAVATIDLADRIASTGTEQKANNQHTGLLFTVDFAAMKQRNATTGFERLILREQVLFGSPVSPLSPPPAIGQGAKVSSVWLIALAKQGLQKWRSSARPAAHGSLVAGSLVAAPTAPVELASVSTVVARPAEIATDDALLMRVGQLLQVSKQRPDGWAFGSVVYDEIDRPPLGVDGLSTQAGWFPVAHTAIATPDQLAKLQEKMGGSSADALAVPSTWTALKDPMVAELVPLGKANDAERAKAVAFFQQALHGHMPGVRIVAVERVQNVSMWQSFAVKRQTIVAREVKAADNHVLTEAEALDAVERVWLFHGTDEDTIPKIVQQGFNRAFCGKNATMYGKGVYFARDSSYSAQLAYSRPTAAGLQHIFLCTPPVPPSAHTRKQLVVTHSEASGCGMSEGSSTYAWCVHAAWQAELSSAHTARGCATRSRPTCARAMVTCSMTRQ